MDDRSPRLARSPAIEISLVLAVILVGCDPFASATPSADLGQASQAAATPTVRPTPSATATPTPRPTPSATPTPTPTPTASPSPTPEPSPTEASVDALVKPCPGRPPSAHVVGSKAPGQSRNWSGYVATHGTFDCVEATWVQPKAPCGGTTGRSSVYWVGIGGYGQRSLVQIGTESSCVHGTAVAAAWHESLPKERFSIRTQTAIGVGDRIWAQVRWLGGSRYRLSLANLSNRQHFSVRVINGTVKRTSAEWIVEAPTGGCPNRCHTLKMPNFGTFRFQAAVATMGGVRWAVDASRFSPVVERMISSSGATRAEVTTTAGTGTAFAIRWRRP